ncbi:MAG TPA: RnfH family protein [Steroidobacteraceae bacterium]|nr:RnfH family protein [Steroidobacteraceae bacterium]
MAASPQKRCTVAYALPQRQFLWEVELPQHASIADALAAARVLAAARGEAGLVPWDAPVGIFGEPRTRQAVPCDGDRVELYRPLPADPRQRRRQQAQREQAQREQARRQRGR